MNRSRLIPDDVTTMDKGPLYAPPLPISVHPGHPSDLAGTQASWAPDLQRALAVAAYIGQQQPQRPRLTPMHMAADRMPSPIRVPLDQLLAKGLT